ncbi:hypothetical protein Q7O56_20215 [Pseudomonas protegens]|uniref:hypothetical protein n=1 Tax=Pseudomonas TaxID=286 RepID=UPI001E48EF1A|nr:MULTISPECIES: hypothetical protein [Pseudomonas]MCE4056327.1 hypothetical protein [Pseudomonas sp. Au-Pse12]MDP9511366.1 hypothetical protein [Pseudomonas protegens]
MSGEGAKKRQQAAAKRCARLRQQGLTLGQIADVTGVDREKVAARITLGERLLSLEVET